MITAEAPLTVVTVGGCRDFQQIIDFLAAYLFPHGDRVIEEYIPTGVSLGGESGPSPHQCLELTRAGHITWRLLRLGISFSFSPSLQIPNFRRSAHQHRDADHRSPL